MQRIYILREGKASPPSPPHKLRGLFEQPELLSVVLGTTVLWRIIQSIQAGVGRHQAQGGDSCQCDSWVDPWRRPARRTGEGCPWKGLWQSARHPRPLGTVPRRGHLLGSLLRRKVSVSAKRMKKDFFF